MGMLEVLVKLMFVTLVACMLLGFCVLLLTLFCCLVQFVGWVAAQLGFDKSARIRRRFLDGEAEALARFTAKEAADLEDATRPRPMLVHAARIRAAGTAIQGDADLGAVGVALGGQRLELLGRVGVLDVDGEDR